MAEAEKDMPVLIGSDVDSDDDDHDSDGGELADFPHEFKKNMKKELSWLLRPEGRSGGRTWVFSDKFDFALQCDPNIPERFLMLIKKIKLALGAFTRYQTLSGPLLVQLWDHITIEGRSLLTTQKRPFALIEFDDEIDKGLCEYRMLSLGYKVYVDGETEEELGPVGRVFRRKLPESTPNVRYYSSKEYPRRKHALRCHVTASAVLPVFEPSSQNCVGVLELVTTEKDADLAANLMLESADYFAFDALEAVGLKSSKVYSFVQDNNKALTPALNEIKEVLAELDKGLAAEFDEDENDACEMLFLVQIWVTWKGCIDVSYMGEGMPSMEIFEDDYEKLFKSASQSIHLRKDNGIVGEALSSHNLLFCADVAQLSIIEYPLAHYAKLAGLSGCFVICLQSRYTENEVYVLKLFLDSQTREDRAALQTLLCRVLRTLKQFFQTFKLASGEDLGEDLPIHVIGFSNGEKCCYTLEPHTIGAPPPPNFLPYAIGYGAPPPPNFLPYTIGAPPPPYFLPYGVIMQPRPPYAHPSSAPPPYAPPPYFLPNEGVMMQQASMRMAPTYLEKKVAKKTKRQHITCEAIEKIYEKMTLVDAAVHFGVSRSTLKRLCRRYGIKEWPFCRIRKFMKGNSSRAKLKQVKESVRGAEGATSLTVPFSVPDALPAAQRENPPGEMLTQDEACQGSEILPHLTAVTISAQPEASTRGGSAENTVSSGTYADLEPIADLSISSSGANLTPSKDARLQGIQLEPQDTLNSTSAKMTIMATFEGDTIKLRLSSSSFSDLENEVAKKLKLKSDTFKMKFPDKDKEIIRMTSDEDFLEFLDIWSSPGGNTIRLLVERIAN